MKTKDVLPDKLSDLILVALADLEKVEADPRYEVAMWTWHQEDIFNKNITVCQVCFAGSVMAKTFNCKLNKEASPSDFPVSAERKLRALNELRVGNLYIAFSELLQRAAFNRTELPLYFFDDNSPTSMEFLSRNNREEWKLHMQTIAGILAAEGL